MTLNCARRRTGQSIPPMTLSIRCVHRSLAGTQAYALQRHATRPASDYTVRVVPFHAAADMPLEADHIRHVAKLFVCRELFGGPDRDRTDDLFHAMEARSQLRHRPTTLSLWAAKGLVKLPSASGVRCWQLRLPTEAVHDAHVHAFRVLKRPAVGRAQVIRRHAERQIWIEVVIQIRPY
jgi:hypothetical protein